MHQIPQFVKKSLQSVLRDRVTQANLGTSERSFNWVTAVFFLFIHAGALFAFVPSNFSWTALGLMLFLHWFCGCLGITLAYHRLLTHRSFSVPKPLEYLLAFIGTLNVEGGPIFWASWHRRHHAYSDTGKDPHDSNQGFMWAHMGWMLYSYAEWNGIENYSRNVPDLAKDPIHRFIDRYFLLPTIALGVLLYALGGWSFVVWGIFMRIVLVWHTTWLVNSATHLWGYENFKSKDHSKNLWWVAWLTYGEGWHNNHHAQARSAQAGVMWWEIDVTFWVIWILEKLGLATDVQRTTRPVK